MSIKLVFAVLAMIVTAIGYVPYFRDILTKKTKPHTYSWLVWAITQGTATLALIYGGGNLGSLSLGLGTLLVLAVFFLSFKYGTKNITKTDTFALIVALVAILVWWQLDSPLLAVLMVTLIDAIGFIPTLRKTYVEPHSETVFFWIFMTIANIFAMLANSQYNLLTMAYLVVLALGNFTVALIIIFRRKKAILFIDNTNL